MSLEQLRSQLPDYAKDIRLNLSSVLTEEGAADLDMAQIYGIALASAYTTGNKSLSEAILAEASNHLSSAEIEAAKSSAVIMGMNNIYYRFVHLASDKSFASMPAKLRMNVIANPGVDKVKFELNSFAVSVINGCGMCIDAHAKTLMKEGVSAQAIQSAARIAAVINATNVALNIS